jgi:predicted CXXCH cytochrome family protein
MKAKTEQTLAFCLGIVCFIVGVVCYAAFPVNTPEEPVRIMFKSAAGNVFFDHKGHASDDGYGIDCNDCHHAFDAEESEQPTSCGDCHEPDSSEESPKISDAFHMQCVGCHEDEGMGPTECAECHVR